MGDAQSTLDPLPVDWRWREASNNGDEEVAPNRVRVRLNEATKNKSKESAVYCKQWKK